MKIFSHLSNGVQSYGHLRKFLMELKIVSLLFLTCISTVNASPGLPDKILVSPDTENISLINPPATNEPQQKVITGTVTDKNGEPVVGANVVVTGTTVGTLTDIDGIYSLEIPPGSVSLTISFIGMESQEILLGTSSRINVILDESAIGLDEVLVIGYGTATKATITGSVATVSGEQLSVSKAVNFSNSLAGRVSGLTTVTRSGLPGNDDPILRIRGSNTLNDNSPLIVIDGIANRSIGRLSSADIESVIVLKDASAAIYGAQAANGVILVTTKRGSAGKMKLEVGYNQGFSRPTIIPEMTDSYLYSTIMNEIDYYENHTPRYTEEDIEKFRSGSDPWSHPNTDFLAELYKPFSLENNANVNLSGGTETLKYFVSFGTRNQEGMWKQSAANYSQYDFRSNIDAAVTKNITLSLDLSGRQENRDLPTFNETEIMEYHDRSKPIDIAWWHNGLPGPGVEGAYNPVVLVTDRTGSNKDRRYIMESNMKLNINIPWIKGLSVTGNASIDKNFRTNKVFTIPYYLHTWDKVSLDSEGMPVLNATKQGVVQPTLSQESRNGQQVTLNGLVNYERRFAQHRIKMLAGTESSKGEYNRFSASRKYFISDAIAELFAGGDLEKDNYGSSGQNARLNYFGRFNYDFSSKYLFEFVWRIDGSYKFPENSRWGFFPGVSAGWVLSQENFWKNNIAFIDYFKIRGSWGKTGNDRIDAFQFLSTYGFGNQSMLYGLAGDQWTTNVNVINKILQERSIPNVNVTWEIANQSNIGFDIRTLGGSLRLEADYFYNVRSNILTPRNASVPVSTGLVLPPENIGEVVNQGFEFIVSYNGRRGDFGYDISANGGYSKNKIVFWDETPGIPEYQQTTGHPMNSRLYYQVIGVFRDQEALEAYPHWVAAQPGDLIFKDVNEDGAINQLDMVRDFRGDIPTFTGGLNLDLTYKNFYATVLLQGALGKIRYKTYAPGDGGNYLMEDAEGRWTVDNIDATKPRAWNYDNDYWRSNRNTYWIQNADYVRVKNIELGYNMPESINSRLGLSGMRIYVGGLNLFTLCPGLESYDPESVSKDYPLAKVINMGATITF
jgi:TonB-dependent starch-binding outer membrane protein SusC